MVHLARAAGVSPSLVLKIFGTKRRLFNAVVDAIANRQEQVTSQALPEESPRAVFRSVLDRWSNPAVVRIALFGLIPRCRRARTLLDMLVQESTRVREDLRRLQCMGSIRADVDCRLVGWLLVGLIAQSIVYRNVGLEESRKGHRPDLARTMDLMINGIK